MFFSASTFNKFYKKLDTETPGKLNLERTSSLAYFLATDKVQKDEEVDTVDVHTKSELRKKFTEAVANLFVLGTFKEYEYQANYLGQIHMDSNLMVIKTGRNFLSTQVNTASKYSEPVDYPTRPSNSAILILGNQTDLGKSAIKKHDDWQKHFMNFIDFRLCGNDTFPLIVFLLRNKDLDTTKTIEEFLREGLYEEFSEELSDFLLDNAEIPNLKIPESFSDSKWTVEDLDDELFKNKEPLRAPVSSSHYPSLSLSEDVPRNRIIYGAPGTGKSYSLNTEVESYFGHESLSKRVTFHPNYTYNQFIGTYKPVPLYKETDKKVYNTNRVEELEEKVEPIIDYQFVPGPFISTLLKSIQNPESSFVLIIEEINRANAAGVFGDTFQLLDRDEQGVSEYSITFNADVMKYLKSMGVDQKEIKLPENFFIWATMNSADQGVSPMDTAFKRRWSFEYLPLNENEEKMDDQYIELPFLEGEQVSWNKFRKVINNHIKDFVSEDKLIGPFFLKPYELKNHSILKNKLLLYLRDDVLRYNYDKLFLKKTFSDIVSDYDNNKNIFIFSEEELRSDQ